MFDKNKKAKLYKELLEFCDKHDLTLQQFDYNGFIKTVYVHLGLK